MHCEWFLNPGVPFSCFVCTLCTISPTVDIFENVKIQHLGLKVRHTDTWYLTAVVCHPRFFQDTNHWQTLHPCAPLWKISGTQNWWTMAANLLRAFCIPLPCATQSEIILKGDPTRTWDSNFRQGDKTKYLKEAPLPFKKRPSPFSLAPVCCSSVGESEGDGKGEWSHDGYRDESHGDSSVSEGKRKLPQSAQLCHRAESKYTSFLNRGHVCHTCVGVSATCYTNMTPTCVH